MRKIINIYLTLFAILFSGVFSQEDLDQLQIQEPQLIPLNQTDYWEAESLESDHGRSLQLFAKAKSKRESEKAAEPCTKENEYWNFRTSDCDPCPRGCSECWMDLDSYQIECTACSKGFTTTNSYSYCWPVCMNGTFFENTHDACYSCGEGCRYCEWDWTAEKFECLECLPGYTLSNEKPKCLNMTCPTGEIFNDKTEQCERCSDPFCLSCVWDYPNRESRCVECPQNYSRTSSGECLYLSRTNPCSNSQYYDPYHDSCGSCPKYCSICSLAEESQRVVCHSCNSDAPLNDEWGLCEPDCSNTEFYDFEVDYCLACPNGCTRCQLRKTGETECSQCALGFKLINGRCYKNCGKTENFNINAFNCLDCPSSCDRCVYNEHSKETQCFSCQDDGAFNLNFHQCEYQCSSGSFFNFHETQSCESCPTSCNGCSQSFEDGVTCSSCSGRYWKNQYSQCLAQDCPQGSVWDSNYDCLACNQEKYRYDPVLRACIPLASCPDYGYYQNQTSLQCFRCPEGCQYCTELDVCLGCYQAYTLQPNGSCLSRCADKFFEFHTRQDKCNLVCPEGYYENEEKTTCLSCPEGCVTCANSTYCYDCSLGYDMTDTNQCEQLCDHPNIFFNNFTNECDMVCSEDAQWKNFVQFRCEDCPSGCTFCSGPNICTACDNQHLINETDNLCHAICEQESAFWNYTSGQCEYYQNCTAEATFLNKSENLCQNCIEGCEICDNAATCTYCYNNYYQDEEAGTCEMRCPDDFYIWSQSQKKCIPWIVCPTGSYLSIDARECMQCGDDCMECVSTRSCTKCFSESMKPNGGRCVSKCSDKKTYWQTESQSCQPKCSGNYHWNPVTEVCFFCDDGQFFNNQTIKCNRCPEGCLYCDSDDSCLTCFDQFHIDEQTNSSTYGECTLRCEDESKFWNVTTEACEDKCNSTQYYSYSVKRCVTCSKGCLNCTNRTCIECDNPQYVMTPFDFCLDVCQHNFTDYDPYTKTCLNPACAGGYFFDEDASSCRYCPSSCNTCNKIGKCDDCAYPQYKQFLVDSLEWVPEPADQVLDGTEFQCLDYCLEFDQVYVEALGTCEDIASCDDTGEYYDDYSNSCFSCSENCLKCTSSISCTKCDEPHYFVEYSLGELYCADACVDVGKVWVETIEACEYEENCENAQYLDPSDNNCYDCQVQCLTCSDGDSCDMELLQIHGEVDFGGEVKEKEEEEKVGAFRALQVITGCAVVVVLSILLWLYLALRRKNKKLEPKPASIPVPQTDRDNVNNTLEMSEIRKDVSERSMDKGDSFRSEQNQSELLEEAQSKPEEKPRFKSISTFAEMVDN